MTTKEMVSNECSNYFSDGYCCIKDKKCIYFSKGSRCNYFEKNVLPLDAESEAIYYQELEEGRLSAKKKEAILQAKHDRNRPRKKCEICGKVFTAESNRQKYCTSCKRKVHNHSQKKYRTRRSGTCDR